MAPAGRQAHESPRATPPAAALWLWPLPWRRRQELRRASPRPSPASGELFAYCRPEHPSRSASTSQLKLRRTSAYRKREPDLLPTTLGWRALSGLSMIGVPELPRMRRQQRPSFFGARDEVPARNGATHIWASVSNDRSAAIAAYGSGCELE